MTQMTAAVLVETGRDLQVIDGITIPELLSGQVRVELAYSAVCQSQIMETDGGRGHDPYLPHLLGHEGVGIVRDIGAGVSKVKIGDWVILGWIKGYGADVAGAIYDSPIGKINSGGVTTFSQQTIASENRLVKLPEGVPPKVSVLFGCALPTGAGLVLKEANPPEGSTIAVFGLGGVGLSSLLVASLTQPSQLIAVDVSESKLRLAREMGATHTINVNSEDAPRVISALTDGKGVDFSFEASGTTRGIEQAFESVRDHGGICVFASHPDNSQKISLEPHAFHRGKVLKGSWGGSIHPDEDLSLLTSLYRRKEAAFDTFLTHAYRLKDINQAMHDLREGKLVRALIEINPELSD